VIGAGGGVGVYAVQIAAARGSVVTGVCSTSKLDLVRSLGASSVIDYRASELTSEYDLILDIAGNRPLSVLRRLLAPRGTLVLVGGENGGRVLGGLERTLGALLLSPFIGHKLRGLISTETRSALEELAALVAAGQVRPVLDRAFPLGEAPSALKYAQEGRARGKVVVTV